MGPVTTTQLNHSVLAPINDASDQWVGRVAVGIDALNVIQGDFHFFNLLQLQVQAIAQIRSLHDADETSNDSGDDGAAVHDKDWFVFLAPRME